MTTDRADGHAERAAVEGLQATIRHADTKAAILLGVTGSTIATAADHLAAALPVRHSVAALAMCAVLGGVAAVTTWHLLAAMRPRGTSAGRQSGGESDRRPEEESAELGRIAAAKHREVRRAISWLLVMLPTAGLITVAAITGSL